jgi:type IV secretion/conjugal transfer VirB4 family ATPase
MVKLKRLLKPYRDAGAFHSLLGPHCFLDEQVFLTKANQIGVILSVEGIDHECVTDERLEYISRRVRAAWRGFDENFRIYQYVVKQDHEPMEPSGDFPNTATWKTAEDRRQFLEERNLFSIRIFYVILFEAPLSRKLGMRLSTRNVLRVMTKQLDRNCVRLRGQTKSFIETIGDLCCLSILNKHDAFAFFRLLANLDPQVAESEKLKHDSHVDFYMASQTVACASEGLAIGRVPVEVLSMKEPPSATFPNVFRDLLAIQSNFILCSEFKRVCQTAAVSAIRGAQTHWYWSQWVSDPAAILSMALNRGNRENVIADKSAVKDVEALDETLSRVNNGGEHLGEFSFTVLLYGEDREQLEPAAASVVKVFGNHEASLIRESFNSLNAYLSIIPGNNVFNLRRTWLLSGNYADLSFLYAPDGGERHNRHSGGDHLVVLETNEATPYYFHIWEGDRLGTLIFGAPGAGKSVLANLIVDHSQKDSPRTFILDLGGSYRSITEKHGGSYFSLDFREGRQTFQINPFVLAGTKENIQFLFSFVRLLLTHGGCVPSAADDTELFEAVESMYVLPEAQRRLANLALGLPKRLAAYLAAWIGAGQYGSIFDNLHDTLTLSHFQTFDFQSSNELYPQVMEPLLFYIFQRISQVVYDPELALVPKQLWADEVWRFLSNDTARQYLISAGKTWRKRYGGIGLITQSAADLQNAGILALANEVCPKKLLLASPGADLATYQQLFKLNDREVELFAGLIPKRQFLEKTATRSKVLNVFLDRTALTVYGNSPNGREQRLRRIAG